jgi:ADP-ribose pyrophosphatase YjhB (NUDIX family)
MEDNWLAHAKRLQALASSGMGFTHDEYDKERYEEIAEIANSMMAEIGQVPIARIEALVSPFAEGYATPKIDVRAAVFQEGKVLLVKEKTDGLWTMPGGYADVGLSAMENVEKEVLEEANLKVRASHMISVRHKAKGGYAQDVRDFYKIFFLCDLLELVEPQAGMETEDAGYFDLGDIPALSKGRIIEEDIHNAWRFSQSDQKVTFFD